MDTDRKWVIVRIDGKIAAVSTDYKALAGITGRLASAKNPEDSVKYSEIIASTVSFDEVWKLRKETIWMTYFFSAQTSRRKSGESSGN